jgi:hypothetical protein
MQRYRPETQNRTAGRTVSAGTWALPERALTAERYAQWRATGPEGSPQLQTVCDHVVTDLVDKHEIVPKHREKALRDWLDVTVCGYFEETEWTRCELTKHQALNCQRKIERLGKNLRGQLARLYGSAAYQDIGALEQILSRAQQYHHRILGDRSTKKDNATNEALQHLSQQICMFWVPNSWWDLRRLPCNLTTELSKTPNYFSFARYIYALVGETRSNRMMKERLRSAERKVASEWAHQMWRPEWASPGNFTGTGVIS